MGLDAFVLCSCYRDGSATPFAQAELLTPDAYGYPRLELPYQGHEAIHDLFSRWMGSCCPHRAMRYASERVASWGGYRAFQQALADAGWEQFPVLRSELPEANVGEMSAERAALALQELGRFQELAQLPARVVLVDTDTGEELCRYLPGYRGLLLLSEVKAGIDEAGFVVVESRGQQHELFRSRCFEQRIDPVRGRTEYVAFDGSATWSAPRPLIGRPGAMQGRSLQRDDDHLYARYPRYLSLEERRQTPRDFSYILRPLTTLFQAAVATGNPVHWA